MSAGSRHLQQSEVFCILAVFFIVGCLSAEHLAKTEAQRAERAKSALREVQLQLTRSRNELNRLVIENKRLLAELSKRPDRPLVTFYSEKDEREHDGFRFKSGKAEMPEKLRELLLRDIPELNRLSSQYECDTVEVIGHTDDYSIDGLVRQPGISASSRSNLDFELLRSLSSESDAVLRAGSNVDLGMMRAVEVVKFLRQRQTASRESLPRIVYFLPRSAGQTILPTGMLADATDSQVRDSARRRIEIHLRKSTRSEQLQLSPARPAQPPSR